jgi:hypothetical protein
MDYIIAKIKAYVLVIDSSLTDNDYLDFIIAETVDRVLSYCNRQQLVRQYEEDVVDRPITDKTDDTEAYYTYWKYYDRYPIPPEIERAIAKVVVSNYKTIDANKDATGNVITNISDNGQSVSYGEELESYFASKSDTDIFSSIKTTLDKYRLPNIVENHTGGYYGYSRGL